MVVPTPDATRVCVREFDSYHQFLAAWIAERQSRQPGYSFQVLANRAGLKSRSTLCQVAQGTRSISPTAAASLARAMRLSEWEVDCFLALVCYNNAKDPLEAESMRRSWERMRWMMMPVGVSIGANEAGELTLKN